MELPKNTSLPMIEPLLEKPTRTIITHVKYLITASTLLKRDFQADRLLQTSYRFPFFLLVQVVLTMILMQLLSQAARRFGLFL